MLDTNMPPAQATRISYMDTGAQNDVENQAPNQCDGVELLSENEAEALFKGPMDVRCKEPLSVDDVHAYLSNVLRRTNRGQISEKRGRALKEIALAVKDVAEAIQERAFRREEIDKLDRLREQLQAAQFRALPPAAGQQPEQYPWMKEGV